MPLPKPRHIAERDGTRKDRIRSTLQDKVTCRVPPMPKHLRRDKYTKGFWVWITHQLGEDGLKLLAECDQKIIEIACGVYRAMRESEARCIKDGRSIEYYNEDGEMTSVKRAPWDIAYRDYSLQLSKMLNELALTPTARARYVIPEEDRTEDIENDTRRAIKKFEPDAG